MLGKNKKIEKVLNGQLDYVELTKYDIALEVVNQLKLKHSLDFNSARALSHDLTTYQRMSKFEGKRVYSKEDLEMEMEVIARSFMKTLGIDIPEEDVAASEEDSIVAGDNSNSTDRFSEKDINNLFDANGLVFSANEVRLYTNMFNIISSFTNNKLTLEEMFEAYDYLGDIITGNNLKAAIHVAKEDRIRTQVRFMESMESTKGKLTDEEKARFAFCVYHTLCVGVYDEERDEVVLGLHDFTDEEHVELLYQEDRERNADRYVFGDNEEILTNTETFGYSDDNPIITVSIPDSKAYLDRLRKPGYSVRYERISSCTGPKGGILDKYNVISTNVNTGETEETIVYVDPYGYFNSSEAPKGFVLDGNETVFEPEEPKKPEQAPVKSRCDSDSNNEFINEDFEIVDDTLVRYYGDDEVVYIPEGVRIIGDSAFDRVEYDNEKDELIGEPCHSKVVHIPEGVETIGHSAFSMMDELVKVYIPTSLKVIDDFAFTQCFKLEQIELPFGLEKIGEWAFSETAFTEIVVPETVTEIGNWAIDKYVVEKIIGKRGTCVEEFALENDIAFVDLDGGTTVAEDVNDAEYEEESEEELKVVEYDDLPEVIFQGIAITVEGIEELIEEYFPDMQYNVPNFELITSSYMLTSITNGLIMFSGADMKKAVQASVEAMRMVAGQFDDPNAAVKVLQHSNGFATEDLMAFTATDKNLPGYRELVEHSIVEDVGQYNLEEVKMQMNNMVDFYSSKLDEIYKDMSVE